MMTRDTTQSYFQSLKNQKGWDTFLSDAMIFTSYTSNIKRIMGKGALLEGTTGF